MLSIETVRLMNSEQQRLLMKNIVRITLSVLIEREHLEPEQIIDWDLKYYPELMKTRGFAAGTFVLPNGEHFITIDPAIEFDDIFEALVHETVHLAQFFKNDTRNGEQKDEMIWRGTSYKILPPDHPDYKKQPWEEEAFRLTPELKELVRQSWIKESNYK